MILLLLIIFFGFMFLLLLIRVIDNYKRKLARRKELETYFESWSFHLENKEDSTVIVGKFFGYEIYKYFDLNYLYDDRNNFLNQFTIEEQEILVKAFEEKASRSIYHFDKCKELWS